MAENPQSPGRFKPEMPSIPGVALPPPKQTKPALPKWGVSARAGVAIAGGLLLGVILAWWTLRPRPQAPSSVAPPETSSAESVPPAPATAATDTTTQLPVVAPSGPVVVAALQELPKPWSSKQFSFRKRLTGEPIPALLIRLPTGGANRAEAYWALSLRAPFGRCDLEYVTDLNQLASRYGYRARHPMVGDPCTGTVYDPLRLGSLSNGVWVRGEVVQGAGVRPPIGIEVRVRGKEIIATQIE